MIFGSCVSRDPFDRPATKLEINDYFARSSFASLSGAPFSGELNLESIQSNFQRRMIQRDAQKTIIQEFKKNEFDLLLIDLIDDRFDLLILPDGQTITLSAELRKTIKEQQITPKAKTLKAFSKDYLDLWRIGYKKFIEVIKENKSIGKIYINAASWAPIDDRGNQFDERTSTLINEANRYLELAYKIISQDIPEHQFIFPQKDFLIADSMHKWGRTPFHLISRFEDNLIKELTKKSLQKGI